MKDRIISIIKDSKTYRFTVFAGDNILQTALDEEINLPYSCQMGVCGSCKAKLISGTIDLANQTVLSEQEVNEGYCLTCVGYPTNDTVLINYDL